MKTRPEVLHHHRQLNSYLLVRNNAYSDNSSLKFLVLRKCTSAWLFLMRKTLFKIKEFKLFLGPSNYKYQQKIYRPIKNNNRSVKLVPTLIIEMQMLLKNVNCWIGKYFRSKRIRYSALQINFVQSISISRMKKPYAITFQH